VDIISGLSAASQAIKIAKDLRSLDRSVDEADFKLKLAELTEALADTRIALSEAKEDIAEKDSEIRKLQSQLESVRAGEMCPVCGEGRLKTKQVVDHPTFGELGVQEKHLSCDNPNCQHSEKRTHDPVGFLHK